MGLPLWSPSDCRVSALTLGSSSDCAPLSVCGSLVYNPDLGPGVHSSFTVSLITAHCDWFSLAFYLLWRTSDSWGVSHQCL